MYAPVGENSEIATYSENLTIALQKLPFLEVVTVPILVGKQSLAHYVEVAEKLNSDEIDLIHLQHEPYFWGEITPDGSAFWQMRYLLKKPLVLTRATGQDSDRFWTSIPQGRQKEAEEIGPLIGEYILSTQS